MDGFHNGLIWIAIPVVPLLVGAGLLWLAWGQFSDSRQRLADGLVVTGEVVGFDDKYDYDDGETTYYPQIRFTPSLGGSVTFTSSTGGRKSAYDIGEKVEVLYNAKAPEKATLKSFSSLYVSTLIFAILGTAFLAIGVVLGWLIRSGK